MLTDKFGTHHTSNSGPAIAAFEEATFAVGAHRPLGDSLTRALEHDRDLVSGWALRSIGQTLLARAETVAAGVNDAVSAQGALERVKGGTAPERALVAAAQMAAAGQLKAAASILEAQLAEDPRQFLIAKAAHGMRFMTGQPAHMLAVTRSVLPAWRESDPGYGFLLGCKAFALEELGQFREAEAAGRRALELEPADAWGLHAVSHVMEMTGRVSEGRDWLERSRPLWPLCNNFRFHLAWHLALFQLEAGDADAVLELYDREIMPVPSDDFRDMSNAVSLLVRAEQAGIDVDDRWQRLREVALKRQQDATYVFAALHYLLALVANGEREAADRLIDMLAARSEAGMDDQGIIAHRFGLQLARVLAGSGSMPTTDFAALAERLSELGGSNAQRDLFMRILLVAATRGDLDGMVATLLRKRRLLKAEDRFARRILAARTLRDARGAA